jgi:hypothetical protein
MKKLLLAFVFIIILVSSVQAGPFLICDPIPLGNLKPQYYIVTGASWVPLSNPAQEDGSIKMDVAAALPGTVSLSVKACITDGVWDEVCSVIVPFSLVRPAPPLSPVNIRLVP